MPRRVPELSEGIGVGRNKTIQARSARWCFRRIWMMFAGNTGFRCRSNRLIPAYGTMGDEAIEKLFVLTAQVGAENVKVVIAPHDPRAYPLKADSEELPEWTPELYSIISREIEALSPVVKSAKTGL